MVNPRLKYETNRRFIESDLKSKPYRSEVSMECKTMYSNFINRNTMLTDDLSSLKSDSTSIRSTSGKSTESPIPEAYVLSEYLVKSFQFIL